MSSGSIASNISQLCEKYFMQPLIRSRSLPTNVGTGSNVSILDLFFSILLSHPRKRSNVQCKLAFYLISRFRNCTATVILCKSNDTLNCSFFICQGTSNNRSRTIPYIHLRRRKGKCMRTFCMRFLPPAAACSGAVAWELNIIANRRLGKTEPGKTN